jgi:hypothetical protein
MKKLMGIFIIQSLIFSTQSFGAEFSAAQVSANAVRTLESISQKALAPNESLRKYYSDLMDKEMIEYAGLIDSTIFTRAKEMLNTWIDAKNERDFSNQLLEKINALGNNPYQAEQAALLNDFFENEFGGTWYQEAEEKDKRDAWLQSDFNIRVLEWGFREEILKRRALARSTPQ